MLEAGEVEYGHAVLTNSSDAYEEWLRKYPEHPRRANVITLLLRLNEESLWKRAQAAVSVEDKTNALDVLLIAFPDGVYAQKAKDEMKEITAAPVVSSVSPPPPVLSPPPSGQPAPASAQPTPPSAPAPPQSTPPTPAPVSSPVRLYPNMDAPGNDRGAWMAHVDIDQCESACQSDPGCVGFTYNVAASACFPKSQITQLTPASQSAVTGVLTDRVSVSAGVSTLSVQRYLGKDAWGNDRGKWLKHVASEDDCQRACVSDSGCVGYTYNIAALACIPKSRIAHLTPSQSAVTGVLIDRAVHRYVGKDAPGNDHGKWLSQVPTEDECQRACLSDSDCVGYTYNIAASACFPKSRITQLIPASQSAVTGVLDR